MSSLRFTALMRIHGVNPYVLVSAKRASKLKADWRRPMPVNAILPGRYGLFRVVRRASWLGLGRTANKIPAGADFLYTFCLSSRQHLSSLRSGDSRALARAISTVENHASGWAELLKEL